MGRWKVRMARSRVRSFVYACALLSLLAYGVPRLPALRPGWAGTFSMLWILFAGLAFAANVYFAVGADRERSRMLAEKEIAPAPHAGEVRLRRRAH
ncbi:hypothetical protein GCM10010885_21010 [Alicyclobacillus cellulosilyticus]|uniref:Uncharacterized protein n=1 Tax=Alicyclobacillus cellulosilyticus TaxID=1003997 RepID=A0A917NMC0_9BACL|nr:hypothetical protein [Alicyclobacillus cellulosilyticus]GGJ11487.1 hypothetical protein GCM10010885_21010 [Alicyclobacillus cellulosilyticus]